MKTRIAVAVASLFVASLGAAAYAQAPQQTTPQEPASATTSASMSNNGQSSMSNGQSNMSNTSSSQVEQKIKHALTSHGVTATDVNVSFDNGTATLSGTVYNQRDIAKAKKAAMRVRGVKQVDTSGLHARGSQPSSAQS